MTWLIAKFAGAWGWVVLVGGGIALVAGYLWNMRRKARAEGKRALRAAQKDEVLKRIKDRDEDESDIGAAGDERLLDELSDRRDKSG